MFVKICGVTSEADALLAVAMGADAVGFVFAPSPRQVSATAVYDIVRRLPADVLTVGVFRNDAPDRVIKVVEQAGLKAAQLHGFESADDTRAVRSRVPMVLKAFAAGDPAVDRFEEYGADVLLVDAPSPGSGQVFDWSLVEAAPVGARVLLAGGLHPGNVAQAIEQVEPWGVDVSTGVEKAPGQKDPVRVKAFIANARDAAPARYEGSADGPYDWMIDE